MTDLKELIEVVKSVGSNLKDIHVKGSSVSSKEGHSNFVTKYDKLTQDALEKAFKEHWPEYKFIAEEQDEDQALSDEPTFIVDPIDGTNNFMFAIPISAISVALVEKQETVQAVIYNFFTDDLYYAEKGKGAYLNGERLKVSDLPMSESLFGLGTSPYYPETLDSVAILLKQLIPLTVDIRRLGSSAIDLPYVAAGKFGGFCELRLQVWDFAAAMLICKEAGAIISDLEQNEIDLAAGPSDIIVASPRVYKEFFEKVDLSEINLKAL